MQSQFLHISVEGVPSASQSANFGVILREIAIAQNLDHARRLIECTGLPFIGIIGGSHLAVHALTWNGSSFDTADERLLFIVEKAHFSITATKKR